MGDQSAEAKPALQGMGSWPNFSHLFRNMSPESTYAFNDLADMVKANRLYVNIFTVTK